MSDQRPQESSSNHSCLSQHTCTHAIMSPGTLYHGANGFTLDDRYKSPQMSPNLKRPRLDSNTAKLELSCYQLNIEGIHNMQRHHAGMSVICMNWIALCFQNMGAWWCLCMFVPQKEAELNSNSKADRIWKNGQLMSERWLQLVQPSHAESPARTSEASKSRYMILCASSLHRDAACTTQKMRES